MDLKRLFLVSALCINSFAASATVLTSGLGGAAGFGENTLAANDDDSTAFLDLSTVFSGGLDFFGTNYTGLYLNNNGNLTFNSPQSTFTPSVITGATSNPIIAAYFADVDTRGGAATATPGGNSTGSNLVYWDLDVPAGIFTATWDDVGYFSNQTDLLNSFQIALIDQGNGDFDIEFRYEALNWTTGGASGGTGGLGGTVARAGWSSGNGTDFAELSASGNQDDMLNLTNTSNVRVDGLYRFEVRNGQISTPVSEPGTLALFGLTLLALAGRRRLKK